MKKRPGIFNDVIGPVMRGPSSSHTAASWRIGKSALYLLKSKLKSALIEFDKNGAWAPNYKEQGTVMGINGGLLGLAIKDPLMKDTEKVALEKGIDIQYAIGSFPTKHANTVRMTLEGSDHDKVSLMAVSLGGGSFEIQSVNGFEVSIHGDAYELLIFTKKEINKIITSFLGDTYECIPNKEGQDFLYRLSTIAPLSNEIIKELKCLNEASGVFQVNPVMPLITFQEIPVYQNTIKSFLEYAEIHNKDLGDLGLEYEKANCKLSETGLKEMMLDIIYVIENSIICGLEGTDYSDRILGPQAHLVKTAELAGKVPDKNIINRVVENVSAIMESKSAMEVIVASPTAGSCGTVGGVLKALSDTYQYSEEDIIKAYFAAGIVGAYFAAGPGFSAEEHGCQVECGAASGMAAAAIVQLYGGSAKQAIGAASMAIQNMIGLICDPVADRVEVPCLGKNISAAMNALSSATMAVSGFNEVIPFDEVIKTVERVSKDMPTCVKCTGKGGLAITEKALKIKDQLEKVNSK